MQSSESTDKQAEDTAPILSEDELVFTEECRPLLCDADRDFVLSLLANPPGPNDALKKAAREYRQRRER